MPTDIKQKFIDFFEGYWFPVYIALNVIIGHVFNAIHYGVLMIVIGTCAGFLLCKDLKFFLSPLLSFYFIFSKDVLEGETLYYTSSIIFFVMCIIALTVCIVAHFVINRSDIKMRRFYKSSLFKGFIALVSLLILNGFFAFKDYNKENIIFGVLIAISFVLPFMIFSINLRIDKKTVTHLVYVLLIVSYILAIELISLYCTDVLIVDGKIYKRTINLGWGVSNNIGAMLAMLMPVHFYCAMKSKCPIPFFISGIACYVLVLLSMSRTSILAATVILVACLTFICIYKHKKIMTNRFSTIVFLFLVAMGLIFFEDEFNRAFEQIIDAGLDDSGRFEYYKDGIDKFLQHPIFGAGFGNSHGVNDKFVIAAPEYFHNTIIQMLASCGALGFIAYGFHRFETVRLFIRNRTPLSFFFGMAVLTLLLTSLLDIHLFNIFPTIFYSVILCVFERNAKFEHQRAMKMNSNTQH